MSEVWLLGAGFSYALSDNLSEAERMPLTAELASRLVARADDGFFTERTWEVVRGLPELLGDDAEAWLTYLLASAPYLEEVEQLRNRAAGLELARAISEVVRDAQEVVIGEGLADWGELVARRWIDEGAEIVTLNYDTLAEELLQRNRHTNVDTWSPNDVYCYPMRGLGTRGGGGMFGSTELAPVQVFKLHGSINWYREDVPLTSLGAATYVGPSTSHGWDDRKAFAGVRPLILPPTYTKAGFYDLVAVRAQWSAAREAIQYCDELVIVGTSLRSADWDLRQLILTGVLGPAAGPARLSAVQEKTITVVDPNPETSRTATDLLRGHRVLHYESVEDLMDDSTWPS